MSIRWTRTSLIANSKYMEAIGWAKEMAAYVEKTYKTGPVSVWLDSFGQINTLRWTIDFADLASVEKVQAQVMADQSYWQSVEKAMKSGLFVDGATNDVISRQL